MAVIRIARIGLTTADLGRACAFYVEALGFKVIRGPEPAANGANRALLDLGGRELELTAYDTAGAAYPEAGSANDPWFQHFAIVVCDMAAAYSRLVAAGARPISHGGPQLLPPSTGSVTAYKFRDPDGHPLELSHIPNGPWSARPSPGGGPFLGIDHSAIAVAHLGASVDYYTRTLGLRLDGRFLNQGPEQDRLDGLDAVALDIVAVQTPAPGPHLELLHYRSPVSAAAPRRWQENDLPATRLVIEVDGADDAPAGLSPSTQVVSAERPPTLTRDPDGHLLEFVRR